MPKIGRHQTHEALRDTMWVGKSPIAGWLLIVAVVALASLLAWLLH
ncbi:MAG: hypothetical protein JOZ27_06880 [Caulobacteraceae bacterium]|nr:hypothetical protein [Caulobacteraceae bacterium]